MSAIVLRTSNRYELDVVTSALKDAGVPFYADGETAGGVAIDLVLAEHGHGAAAFIVRVPKGATEVALELLRQLPIGGIIDPAEES